MKQKRKKRHIPVFVFSPMGLDITRKAMELYEQSLQQANNEPSKIAFARETMKSVNDKLNSMSESVSATCITTFDYNEKLVIAAAIQLYTLELCSAPSNSQRERALKTCKRIAHFALDNLNLEHPKTTQD